MIIRANQCTSVSKYSISGRYHGSLGLYRAAIRGEIQSHPVPIGCRRTPRRRQLRDARGLYYVASLGGSCQQGPKGRRFSGGNRPTRSLPGRTFLIYQRTEDWLGQCSTPYTPGRLSSSQTRGTARKPVPSSETCLGKVMAVILAGKEESAERA